MVQTKVFKGYKDRWIGKIHSLIRNNSTPNGREPEQQKVTEHIDDRKKYNQISFAFTRIYSDVNTNFDVFIPT